MHACVCACVLCVNRWCSSLTLFGWPSLILLAHPSIALVRLIPLPNRPHPPFRPQLWSDHYQVSIRTIGVAASHRGSLVAHVQTTTTLEPLLRPWSQCFRILTWVSKFGRRGQNTCTLYAVQLEYQTVGIFKLIIRIHRNIWTLTLWPWPFNGHSWVKYICMCDIIKITVVSIHNQSLS